MHVHPCFIGDNNESHFESQHHLYSWLCFKIFDNCRITYLRCNEVCNSLSNHEKINLINIDSYDHRTLQNVHDIIATSFRYLNRENQLSLFELNEDDINNHFIFFYKKWHRGNLNYVNLIWGFHWENYFNKIIMDLTNLNTMRSDFVYHVINASFLNPNIKSGTESEHNLVSILKDYLRLNGIYYNNRIGRNNNL